MKLSSTKIALGLIVILIIVLTSIIIVFNARNRIPEEAFVRDWSNITEMQDEGTYFVYVYADWCPACAQLRNDISAFHRDQPNDINLYQLDVDNVVGQVPAQFGDSGVPTLIIVQNGVWANQVSGIQSVRDVLDAARDGEYN